MIIGRQQSLFGVPEKGRLLLLDKTDEMYVALVDGAQT